MSRITKVFLQVDIVTMEKLGEELSDKAESVKNIALFMRAYGLGNEIKEKRVQIKILEQQISEKKKMTSINFQDFSKFLM